MILVLNLFLCIYFLFSSLLKCLSARCVLTLVALTLITTMFVMLRATLLVPTFSIPSVRTVAILAILLSTARCPTISIRFFKSQWLSILRLLNPSPNPKTPLIFSAQRLMMTIMVRMRKMMNFLISRRFNGVRLYQSGLGRIR